MAEPRDDRMLGFYVHTHWGYNNPYAARTWTLDDWANYLGGLKSLGYNTVMVWPLLDSMPMELTPTDIAWLKRIEGAIGLAHDRFGMRMAVCINSNVIGNENAAKHPFETRPYFQSEVKLNPGDPRHLDMLDAHLRNAFQFLKQADIATIIDSDPGGYIGSSNAEFAEMCARKVRVMREANPSLEFYYWMHVGWENYNRFWAEAREWADPDSDPPLHWDTRVFAETLDALRAKVAEPWGVYCNHLHHFDAAEQLGMGDKRLQLSYGVVEGEPTFPLTNWTPKFMDEWVLHYYPDYSRAQFPRGAMGNAQTHCLQLPHTYLFAHIQQGGSIADADLKGFAAGLLPDLPGLVSDSWSQLETGEPATLEGLARSVRAEVGRNHPAGPHSGLLFGSADRFLEDLAQNLEVRAQIARLKGAGDGADAIRGAMRQFLAVFRPYQARLGFKDAYGAGGALYESMNLQAMKLGDPEVTARCRDFLNWKNPAVRDGLTKNLLTALEKACA